MDVVKFILITLTVPSASIETDLHEYVSPAELTRNAHSIPFIAMQTSLCQVLLNHRAVAATALTAARLATG